MSDFLAYNGWDPLEEIWLGDVWPENFYDDLDSEIRDSFCQITEWSKHDLNIIQKKLQELGVVVRRPFIDSTNKELYCDKWTNKLFKPPIVPRDNHCVIGDKLYYSLFPDQTAWRPVLENYDDTNIVYCCGSKSRLPKSKLDYSIIAANTVRLGKDIIFDHIQPNSNEELLELYHVFITQHLPEFGKDYRVHFTTNGGHSDGCFATLHPELLMSTEYFDEYDLYFPGWEKIKLSAPTYSKQHVSNYRSKLEREIPSSIRWKASDYKGPGNGPPQFHDYVEKYCPAWIGNFTETYFEVNTVMIDEKNMLCMGTHDDLFRDLERHGITCHVVPFRSRTFWDGGLHCITLDTKRKSVLKDYFPERGPAGLGFKSTKLGDNLDQEYANFLKRRGLK